MPPAKSATRARSKSTPRPAPALPTIAVHCAHTRLVDLCTLQPNPRNPNQHPEAQIALLAKIIEKTGWRSPIVVSNRSGFVVKGHGRMMAATRLACAQVPVDFQDYASDEAEMADLLADNAIAELSQNDAEMTASLLRDLQGSDVDLELTGFDAAALQQMLGNEFTPTVPRTRDAEPKTDRAAELVSVWDTRVGQLWQLGPHRLVIGDCRDESLVALLLGNDRPHLMVTDQPYGVAYEPAWRDERLGVREDGTAGRATTEIENDHNADWRDAWANFPGDVAYVWFASLEAVPTLEGLTAADFEARSLIIWNKNSFAVGRGHYHWKHEPCWYAVRKGKTGHWASDRKQNTVWDIDKPQKSETGHSTQKPLECMARPIRNNSQPGEFVYDPFVGSGTTIIAADNLGRVCLAMEKLTAWAAVTLQRYQDATGIKPMLLHQVAVPESMVAAGAAPIPVDPAPDEEPPPAE